MTICFWLREDAQRLQSAQHGAQLGEVALLVAERWKGHCGDQARRDTSLLHGRPYVGCDRVHHDAEVLCPVGPPSPPGFSAA